MLAAPVPTHPAHSPQPTKKKKKNSAVRVCVKASPAEGATPSHKHLFPLGFSQPSNQTSPAGNVQQRGRLNPKVGVWVFGGSWRFWGFSRGVLWEEEGSQGRGNCPRRVGPWGGFHGGSIGVQWGFRGWVVLGRRGGEEGRGGRSSSVPFFPVSFSFPRLLSLPRLPPASSRLVSFTLLCPTFSGPFALLPTLRGSHMTHTRSKNTLAQNLFWPTLTSCIRLSGQRTNILYETFFTTLNKFVSHRST